MAKNDSIEINNLMLEIHDIISNPAKQFKFDNGLVMALMSEKYDNPWFLYHHKIKTNSFDDFCNSIEEFLSLSGEKIELTAGDKTLLSKEYGK